MITLIDFSSFSSFINRIHLHFCLVTNSFTSGVLYRVDIPIFNHCNFLISWEKGAEELKMLEQQSKLGLKTQNSKKSEVATFKINLIW